MGVWKMLTPPNRWVGLAGETFAKLKDVRGAV